MCALTYYIRGSYLGSRSTRRPCDLYFDCMLSYKGMTLADVAEPPIANWYKLALLLLKNECLVICSCICSLFCSYPSFIFHSRYLAQMYSKHYLSLFVFLFFSGLMMYLGCTMLTTQTPYSVHLTFQLSIV